MNQVFLACRAAVYGAGFVALWAWVAVSVRPLDAKLGIEIPGALRSAGWPVAGAGALLALLCVAVFVGRGRGTPAPFDPPREFVASGAYRHVRNPMYIGAAGVIFGFGLAVGSTSIVSLAFAFCAVMHLFVVLYEEPSLERRFGASYRAYKHSVRRWFPGRRYLP